MPRNNRVKVGDFTVPLDELEQAEDSFRQRSKRSRKRDRATRSPVVADYETWQRFQRILDYPGVDTPDDTPRQSAHDFPTPTGRKQLAQDSLGGASGVGLAVGTAGPDTPREAVDESMEKVDTQVTSALESVSPHR